jgi:hypothetical protein
MGGGDWVGITLAPSSNTKVSSGRIPNPDPKRNKKRDAGKAAKAAKDSQRRIVKILCVFLRLCVKVLPKNVKTLLPALAVVSYHFAIRLSCLPS